jgi:peptidoglycan/LPS O-acetylase OafA/YrhL
MTGVSIDTVDDELSVRGDEAGTAPGDRRFRPDVEGLRAVAIVLVVLYHGGLKALSGGYVGVDVFFVISGFVITGLLLRERAGSARTSFLSFYGRRSRRIIPAATLVIVVSVIATYVVLGAIYGNPTAVDGRWTAVFLANFHFSSVGTNYLDQTQPPSPLLNFWSLAVEEQFYLVYPALFVALAVLGRKASFRVRLGIGLVVVIAASFTLSVLQTNSDPTGAYFSPFTRAWELALGALVAVATPWLLRTPRVLSGVVTWLGLGAIAFSAVAFGADTAYPGSLVAIPVLGAALVIAGGMAAPRWAAESVLGLSAPRWVGRISYSLYLWHWPILIIAADEAGKTSLPFEQNVVWLLLALVLSVGTYTLVENPIRHARVLSRGLAPIALGAVFIAATLAVSSVALSSEESKVPRPVPPVSASELAILLRRAPEVRTLPADLMPSLAEAHQDWGGPPSACSPGIDQTSILDSCIFGDTSGSHTMVIYGDSHAGMWFDALNVIAKQARWRLVDLWKGECPADSLPYKVPPELGKPGTPYVACKQWQRWALGRINNLKPDLLVLSQDGRLNQISKPFTFQQWAQGLATTFHRIHLPKSRVVVLGNIPFLPDNPPECLSRHSANIQACSGPLGGSYLTGYNHVEEEVAHSVGARYINVVPWFCSTVCTGVVGHYEVYFDQAHVAATYTYVLEGVLKNALRI